MSEREELVVPVEAAGWRLDQFLAGELERREPVARAATRRARRCSGRRQARKGLSEAARRRTVVVTGQQQVTPLEARAEDIPLEIVYEDDDLAVVNKPAGMMVHAGSGATDEARSGGTLVNALLHRFKTLSRSAAICAPASCTGSTRKPAA
jgi:23S rRNA pseudouridine1911/1915/1917 synthase